jgi:DNA-binding transcriptional regulator GbsR (MarR family)
MEELNRKIIALFKEMGRGQGLEDNLLIEIFARLYIEPEPIAMDDLAEKTGYSLASISNKIKMLGHIAGIKKIKKPGSKKIYLYMDKNFLDIWETALIKKQEYVINKVKEKLPSILKEFKEKAKTPGDEKKLENLKSYYDQTLKLEKIINVMVKEINNIK